MMTESIDLADKLPNTYDALAAFARRLLSELKIEKLARAKAELKAADLLQRMYGPKSEKLNDDQRLLFGILPPADPPLVKIARRSHRTTTPKRKGGGRRYLNTEHLPIVTRVLDVPEEQRVGMVKIREEVTKQLECETRRYYMLHTVRPVYASPTREHAPIVAPLPPQVIPQASVGVGFIVHIIISKYCDHLPLYRQESIDARGGVWVSRQARMRYVEAAAHLLITIREQLKTKILASRYVQVDETFTKLLDPERRGRSRDAYLWGYHAPHEKAVVLEFSPSRSGSILYDFFPRDWGGDVQTDGAKMYPGVFKHRPRIRRFECIAHLRRYVLAAVRANELEALPLLKDIGELYRIERLADERGLSQLQRGYFRHAKAKPILKRLQLSFRALEGRVDVVGKLREAVTYALKRWPQLVAYAKAGNGYILIDQNSIERCFRPTKIGLRNYLYIGHPKAGWRSAVIYSVIGTCRLLGVNPDAYLRWVLPKLASGSNRTTASGLLPHDFARLHQ